MEKPWEREFQTEDPVIVFKRDRPRLVAAALTVLRGYIAAGRPKQAGTPLGDFRGWARLVRDALLARRRRSDADDRGDAQGRSHPAEATKPLLRNGARCSVIAP